MLTKSQAQDKVQKMGNVSIKSWTMYNDLYLFRVQFSMAEEEDFDPFFSVDSNTGEVRDFSVLSDGNINEIAALKWTNI